MHFNLTRDDITESRRRRAAAGAAALAAALDRCTVNFSLRQDEAAREAWGETSLRSAGSPPSSPGSLLGRAESSTPFG